MLPPSRFSLSILLPLATSVCFAQGGAAAPTGAGPLPVETFFKQETMQSVQVSPSGRWMAIQGAEPGERVALKVIDLEGKEKARVIAMFTKLDVASFKWINDDWLVFSVADENDKSGKTYGGGLAAVRRDGEKMRQLIKRQFDSLFQAQGNVALEPNNYMAGVGAPGTNDIVIGENHFDPTFFQYEHTTLRLMDVSTGATRAMFKNLPEPPGKITSWLLDGQGKARVAVGRKDNRVLTFWADAHSGEWRKIADNPWDNNPIAPAYVDDKDQLWVTAINPDTGLGELRQFDFASGKPATTALISLPGFDADATPIRDRGSNKVHGVRLLTDALSVAWFSPTMAAIQAKVDALLPGRVNTVTCHPCEAPKTVLVFSYSDRDPGQYLLYRPEQGKFERIGAARPGHPDKDMAQMELHRAKTRDGADLPVWVTVKRQAPAAPRPAVVLVHGGPWARGSTWGWNAEAQFLASRGYVVIEPEFRGSTGFGDGHFRAGWKQWGQRMQDDVTDALRFAVDKGWVDSKKVCIAGASYGGYSTLIGLAKDPGRYRCGVAWVAVSDPRLLFTVHWSDVSDVARQYSMPEMIGDPEKDAAMLEANSPIALAGKIKAPLLLAYGAKDRRVPLVHGEKMRDALQKAGNMPEWVVYDDEGHGWERTLNKQDFWRRVDAFLGKHLK